MKKEEIKMYCMIAIIFLAILDCILIAASYSQYGACFGINAGIDCIIIGIMVAIIILAVVWCILRAILIKEQGDSYVRISDLIDTIRDVLFPTSPMKKKEILRTVKRLGDEKEIFSSALWKTATKGINVSYFFASVFLFAFGSAICYVVIKEWLDMSAQRVLITVIGVFFILILYFWAFVTFIGVKKRPDSILYYIILHELKFFILSNDFLYAVKCGNGIFIGNEYIFIQIAKGMQVVAKKDVTECSVIRMAGWNPRRLFLPYYLLTVKTENDCIVKYSINPRAFNKLKSEIRAGEQNGDYNKYLLHR